MALFSQDILWIFIDINEKKTYNRQVAMSESEFALVALLLPLIEFSDWSYKEAVDLQDLLLIRRHSENHKISIVERWLQGSFCQKGSFQSD